MIKIWSVVLWSRSYYLTEDSRIIGYIDVNMHLSAHQVGNFVLLSAPMSVLLSDDLSPALREGVQTTLLRYGSLQGYRDDEPIVIAAEQDPWSIRVAIKNSLRDAVHTLGLNLVDISLRRRDVTTMTHVELFFQRAPHLMMLARSQVDGAWTGGPHEASLPRSMFQGDLSIGTIQDLVTWIGASKEERYDALLSTLAQGVTILTAWDQVRP